MQNAVHLCTHDRHRNVVGCSLWYKCGNPMCELNPHHINWTCQQISMGTGSTPGPTIKTQASLSNNLIALFLLYQAPGCKFLENCACGVSQLVSDLSFSHLVIYLLILPICIRKPKWLLVGRNYYGIAFQWTQVGFLDSHCGKQLQYRSETG